MSSKSSPRTYKGVSKNLQNMVLLGTIYGSTKNLSTQGSLENHFLKSLLKEPIKVSQRTLKHGSLKHHFWFHKEPSNQGSLKNHFLKEICNERGTPPPSPDAAWRGLTGLRVVHPVEDDLGRPVPARHHVAGHLRVGLPRQAEVEDLEQEARETEKTRKHGVSFDT